MDENGDRLVTAWLRKAVGKNQRDETTTNRHQCDGAFVNALSKSGGHQSEANLRAGHSQNKKHR